MSRFVFAVALSFMTIGFMGTNILLADEQNSPVFRLGMVGLDTSHVIRFTEWLHDPQNASGCRVVAGFPGGSPDIESSISRVEGYTNELREKHGVEIVANVEELCSKVDGVLITSVDGRPHLEYAKIVFAARKPVFIDKPMAASLPDVIEIFRLAKEGGIPCWSSSSFRYSKNMLEATSGKIGTILGGITYGPCHREPHHPDLYWYGIHTAEALYTLMGPGCVSVTRTYSDGTDVIVGTWKDGRLGIFRGGSSPAPGQSLKAGFIAFGSEDVYHGQPDNYDGLLREIVKFFQTGRPPIAPAETIELFAFMSAADESKAKGGASVELRPLIEQASAAK
ncbi:MAG: Gfo/Idh/MocA family oxidoreductase [Phycisphaerales bacterium]|nr:Gfo/Idh/MocA family oxidoreductase [Phycisphaerales bacterium]